MRYLLTCAGTAGHINPAIAVADALKRADPGAEFLFIGSGRELENRLIPAAGYSVENISVSGLERSVGLKALSGHVKTVLRLVKGSRQAASVLRRFRPDAVIGTGGYVCFPVLKAAHRRGIPCYIHESNAVPGLTTRLLADTADRIFTAFPGVEASYRKPDRVMFMGTPVRGGFSELTQREARERLGVGEERLVVSFWGSLGASQCNRCTAEAIVLNEKDPKYRLIHATGKDGYGAFRDLLASLGADPDRLLHAEVRPYIDDMPVVMQAADLILCRAGASTLAELTATGKPAVLVPSPYVTDNHQEKNAMQLVKAGAAVMLRESECSGELLYSTVERLLADDSGLQRMSSCGHAMGVPDSAERIADLVMGDLTVRKEGRTGG
ncbi:MAG: undecaprenyldiphospho-muramoylpentapeptide beta-N-acetylglucosaminyltransferase [Oscillospiraceae bacterium]|nr:undecaprenyldiphospho-muramoylpentapeptide beta-N-acetylglucosaminyltransferase [Oscillospiraceae bacterium]